MIVEELVSKLGLEVDSNALSVLEKFRSAVVGGLTTMNIAAVGVAGAFVAAVHSVASFGDEIADTSEKLGVSVKSLQELRYAADQSDVSFESLSAGLKFVSKNAAEAAGGSAEALKAFAGVSLFDGGKLKTADQLLLSVTDRFQNIKDPIKQTELAMKLFGKSGVELIPLLKAGGAGIKAFVEDAYAMGVVLDDDVIAASDRFDQQLKRLSSSFVGLRNTFAGAFVGDFADAFQGLADAVRGARPFVASLSLAFRDAGDRMGGMVAIFRRLGEAFSTWLGDSWLGKIISQVRGFKVLEAVLIGLGVVFVATAAQAIGAWLAAAAPFILLSALIGLIVDDIYSFIAGNDSLIGRIQKWAEAVGPADEHPIVRFLRSALALLLDFTDAKHWDNFKKAASDAVDFVSEKVRLALGGKKFTRTNPNAFGQLVPEDYAPAQPEQGGIFGQGGLLDTFGFQRSGFEENVRRGLATEPGTQGLSPTGIHLVGPNASMPQVTNNVTINGSGLSGEELQSRVEGALNASYSKAFSATSGGEQ